MKKFFIIISASLFCSTSLFAKWEKIAESDSFQLYIDKSTLAERNDLKYVWTLLNNKKKEEDYRSRKGQIVLDCDLGRSKALNLYFYEGFMGNGKIIRKHIDIDMKWRSLVPDSIGYKIVKEVCSK